MQKETSLPGLAPGAPGYTYQGLAEMTGVSRAALNAMVWKHNRDVADGPRDGQGRVIGVPIKPFQIQAEHPHTHYYDEAAALAIVEVVRAQQARPKGRPKKPKKGEPHA